MLELNRGKRILSIGGREVSLTKSENNLLMVFYMMGRRVLDMEFLIDTTVANPVKVPQDRIIIHNLIFRLRQKAGSRVIETIRGQGYFLAEEIRLVD